MEKIIKKKQGIEAVHLGYLKKKKVASNRNIFYEVKSFS